MHRTTNRPPAASAATRSIRSALGGQRTRERQAHLDQALRAARVNDMLVALREHMPTLAAAQIEAVQIALIDHVLQHAAQGLDETAVAAFRARVAASWPVNAESQS